MSYDQDLSELSKQISAIAKPFADTVKAHHWISTPDGDQGGEWCGDCGYYKVRNLRRRDRKRREDYVLDGGWRTENDGTRWCSGCGVRLDASLTSYGASEELHHYSKHGFYSFAPEIAYDISELIDHYEYVCEGDDGANARECKRLARSFLAGKHYREIIQPGQWADDGGRAD